MKPDWDIAGLTTRTDTAVKDRGGEWNQDWAPLGGHRYQRIEQENGGECKQHGIILNPLGMETSFFTLFIPRLYKTIYAPFFLAMAAPELENHCIGAR